LYRGYAPVTVDLNRSELIVALQRICG